MPRAVGEERAATAIARKKEITTASQNAAFDTSPRDLRRNAHSDYVAGRDRGCVDDGGGRISPSSFLSHDDPRAL
jgi:hypothetical protein